MNRNRGGEGFYLVICERIEASGIGKCRPLKFCKLGRSTVCNSDPVSINWYKSSDLGAVGKVVAKMSQRWIPRFGGREAYWWLTKVEQHFKVNQVHENMKLLWVMWPLVREALKIQSFVFKIQKTGSEETYSSRGKPRSNGAEGRSR